MKCSECGEEGMVAVQEGAALSVGGVLGALVVVAAIPVLLFSVIAGLLMMILGAIISSVGRPKVLYMVCPSCKARQRI